MEISKSLLTDKFCTLNISLDVSFNLLSLFIEEYIFGPIFPNLWLVASSKGSKFSNMLKKLTTYSDSAMMFLLACKSSGKTTPNNAEQRQTTPNNAKQRRTTPNNAEQRQTTPNNAEQRQQRRTTPNNAEQRRTTPNNVEQRQTYRISHLYGKFMKFSRSCTRMKSSSNRAAFDLQFFLNVVFFKLFKMGDFLSGVKLFSLHF